MSDYVGIVRNDIRLQRASRRLDLLWEETEQLYQTSTLSPQLLELRNMITVGYLIVKGASFRKESRGLHFNTDYPGKSELVQNIVRSEEHTSELQSQSNLVCCLLLE